jgi:hypothetical protein
MISTLTLATILMLASSYLEGQVAPAVKKARSVPVRQAQTLQVTSTRVLTMRGFGFYGVPLSDESGNLYLNENSGVFKLSQLKESDSKMIQVPPDRSGADDSGLDALVDFAVTPSGGLFMLAGDARGQHHIFSFDSDGNVKHDTKLETPEDVLIVNFAVFDNETILATGFYDRTAPKDLHGKSYAAILDQSGQVLKDMTRSILLDAVQVSSDSMGPVNSTYIRPGKDGNLYLLKPSAVLVISPGGEIVRRIKFAKSDPSTYAIGLRVADGMVSVELGDKPAPGPHPSPKYLVLDMATGKEYGYFAKPAEVKGRLASFSREEGFLFVSFEKSTFELISAKMP